MLPPRSNICCGTVSFVLVGVRQTSKVRFTITSLIVTISISCSICSANASEGCPTTTQAQAKRGRLGRPLARARGGAPIRGPDLHICASGRQITVTLDDPRPRLRRFGRARAVCGSKLISSLGVFCAHASFPPSASRRLVG